MNFCRKVDIAPMLGVNLGTGNDRIGLRPGRVLQRADRHVLCRPARQQRPPRAVWRQVLVPGQRDGRPVADRPPGHARVRQQGARGRQDDALARPEHRDGVVRLIQRPDADLPGMGPHCAGDVLGARRLPVDPHVRQQPGRKGHAELPGAATRFEGFVDTMAGTLRYVKAKNRSKHDVYLSWDEWQVWHPGDDARPAGPRPRTWPRLAITSKMRWSWRNG